VHGTGDDNVHYQNTAALVDLLVGEGISPQKMDMMAFTDSDHSINYNNADLYIYRYLSERLLDEVRRGGKEDVHQWSKRGGPKREVEIR
jgi:dipeptidyl-peptidase 4